jgi:nitrogen regulatory protein P-II 1
LGFKTGERKPTIWQRCWFVGFFRFLGISFRRDLFWLRSSRSVKVETAFPKLLLAIALKLIIAIIQPGKLDSVKKALSKVEVVRLTVLDCQGFGRQRGQIDKLAGQQIGLNLLPKLQLQIAVNEEFVDPTVAAITEGGQSGEIGDGKIFVLPMDDCIRIRTGQRGSEAI